MNSELESEPSMQVSKPVLGWSFLWLVIAAIAGLQLVSYFGRPVREDSKYADLDQSIRTALRLRNIFRSLSDKDVAPGADAASTGLKDTISVLAQSKKTDLVAAQFYTIVRSELKDPIDPTDLERLAASKQPEDNAIADIYLGKLTDKTQIDAARKTLGDDFFMYELAVTHALEKASLPGERDRLFNKSKTLAFMFGAMAMGILGILGMGLWFVYGSMSLSGKIAHAGFPASPLTSSEASSLAGRAGLMILGLFVGQVAVALALRPFNVDDSIIGLVASALVIGAAVYIVRAPLDGLRFSLDRIGLRSKDFVKNVGYGILGLAMELPVMSLLALVGMRVFSFLPMPEHPTTTGLADNPSIVMIVTSLIAGAVLAPIFEEICFRGALLPALGTKTKTAISAMILNGLLFAIIHPTGIPAWPALASVGAMSAFVAYHRGSLIPSVVLHAGHNLLLLLVAIGS